MTTQTAPVLAHVESPEPEPVRLKTRQEERDYLALHLKPVGYGPKGQPLYAKDDIDALNIILPDDL